MHLLLARAREGAIQIVQTVESSYTELSTQHEIRSRGWSSMRKLVLSVRAVSTFRCLFKTGRGGEGRVLFPATGNDEGRSDRVCRVCLENFFYDT